MLTTQVPAVFSFSRSCRARANLNDCAPLWRFLFFCFRTVALQAAKMSNAVPFLKDPTYPEGMTGDARFDPLGLAENFDIKVSA